MLRQTLPEYVWAFDGEWVPDAKAGALLYGLSGSEREIFEGMWKEARGKSDQERPYLKELLCRLVSIARVERREEKRGKPVLSLVSAFASDDDSEFKLIRNFLDQAGQKSPCLVGFNHTSSDLKILVQRAVAKGIRAKGFFSRPKKPWEGRDYFYPQGDWIFDLQKQLNLHEFKNSPSLHQAAVMAGIPGKLETSGADVAGLWLNGEYDTIRRYNECDAVTTYLLFLRVCFVCGLFDADAYRFEQTLVLNMLLERQNEPMIKLFLNEWKRLQDYWNFPFRTDLDDIWRNPQSA
jgi:predicted PolB exonuclease-like 3'-5' exonuclease